MFAPLMFKAEFRAAGLDTAFAGKRPDASLVNVVTELALGFPEV